MAQGTIRAAGVCLRAGFTQCVRRSLQQPLRVAKVEKRFLQTSRMMSVALLEQFNKSQERVTKLKEAPDNQVKLQLYALFKQATVGKCNTKKPGAFDMVGKYKWNAWNDLGDIPKEAAQKAYIELVEDLVKAEGGSVEETAEVAASEGAGKYKTLLAKNTDGVFTITLNRPEKKNAINHQMYEEIILALTEAADTDSVKVAVLTGAGDFYCSGNDLSNFMQADKGSIADMAKHGKLLLKRFVTAFIDFKKPLVAVINGPAVGIAVTSLGLCDVVYATERATFHTPMVALGQTAEGCSSVQFGRIMGELRANEMLVLCKKIDARKAYEWGLVTEVFPDATFQENIQAKLKKISQLPRMSLQYSKELIRGANREDLHVANDKECELLEERWQSQECFDAIMNFFQNKTKSNL